MSAKKTEAVTDSLDESATAAIRAGVKRIMIDRAAVSTGVDPHMKNPSLAIHIGRLLAKDLKAPGTHYTNGVGHEVDAVEGYEYTAAASFILHHIKNDSVTDLKKMFDAILIMKSNDLKKRGNHITRAKFLAAALKRFTKSRGNEWFACDFQSYILKTPTADAKAITPPLPAKTSKEWTRIYRNLGISDRVSRTGKARIPKGT
jgi:hypothetical protein